MSWNRVASRMVSLSGTAMPMALRKKALVDQEPASHVLAEQVELARLIGGDGEADLVGAEKAERPGDIE
jgi:hypothetical protein